MDPGRAKGGTMHVMGTNHWTIDVPANVMVDQALKFADAVNERGIAKLHGAWINEDAKVLFCSWDTEDLDGLQTMFDEMNSRSGLVSELTPVNLFYP
jgi:hypothetical protein